MVGLGNPGSKYRGTYHNLGFQAVDTLCSNCPHESVSRESGELYRLKDCCLEFTGKPGLYVNRSGEVVKKWAGKYEIPARRFFIIYDDLDLEVGRIRIRPEGSSGGHNGMQDIIDHLGTDCIPRLRIGIGPLPTNSKGKDFVLSPINKDERKIYRKLLDNIPAIIEKIHKEGINEAMDAWNGVDFSE